MKNLGNAVAAIGILLVVYTVISRFTGNQMINLGFMIAFPRSALTMANSILLIAIIIKQWNK